jgi:hypothetical protein
MPRSPRTPKKLSKSVFQNLFHLLPLRQVISAYKRNERRSMETMSTLGFDKYVEPLKLYLSKYREAVRGDKPEKGGRLE